MKAKLASGLVVSFLLGAGSSGAPRSSQVTPNDGQLQITIGVYDYAHAQPGLPSEAERAATSTLLKAGVETVWLDCSTDDASTPACAKPGDPTHLTLRILSGSMANRWRPLKDGGFGYSVLGEQMNCNGWIVYDRVKDFAIRQGLTFERLLGAVIAHELGHLLLGENVHTRAGLMSARWSREELFAIECGLLAFSDVESKRIQKGALARRQVADAVTTEVSSLDSPMARN